MAIKKVLAGAIAAALLCAVPGCGGAHESTSVHDDSLQKVMIDAGQLVIGLDADFPPMGFSDESGEIAVFTDSVLAYYYIRNARRDIPKVVWMRYHDRTIRGLELSEQ